MSDRTGIEWTDASWNPVTGCTEVSPGCDHCYAKTFAERWRGTPDHHFEQGFDVVLRSERLDQPLRWKKPRRIFVNSMSDLFHDTIPDEFIARVFAVMAVASEHTFQVLTKRHGRMRSLLSRDSFRDEVAEEITELMGAGALRYRSAPIKFDRETEAGNVWGPEVWPLPNVWLGVSVENQQWADIRIPALLKTPAAVRFLSCEPLLGPVDLRLTGSAPSILVEGETTTWHRSIDWVIVGGESGHGARPMHPAWARSLRDQCTEAGIPFLFKQWGEWAPDRGVGDSAVKPDVLLGLDGKGRNWPNRHEAEHLVRIGKKAAGRELDSRTWDQFPQAVVAHV